MHLVEERKKKEKEDCEGQAQMFFTGTRALGCQAYLDSQKEACTCSPFETVKKVGHVDIEEQRKRNEEKEKKQAKEQEDIEEGIKGIGEALNKDNKKRKNKQDKDEL